MAIDLSSGRSVPRAHIATPRYGGAQAAVSILGKGLLQERKSGRNVGDQAYVSIRVTSFASPLSERVFAFLGQSPESLSSPWVLAILAGAQPAISIPVSDPSAFAKKLPSLCRPKSQKADGLPSRGISQNPIG
jgi:hypothetical protein